MLVTLDSIFGELLEEYPETEEVLKEFLGAAYCLTCPGKMYDTIGNGAMIHGLSHERAMEMVEDLQQVVDSYENGGVDNSKTDTEKVHGEGGVLHAAPEQNEVHAQEESHPTLSEEERPLS